MLIVALVILLAAGGVAAWLLTRTHHGTGRLAQPPPAQAPTQVGLCQSCAQGYNPLGDPKDEHPEAGLAVDNDPNTSWTTQHYNSGNLGKPGTGIYVNAAPGVAARILQLRTGTPGFNVTIYARTTKPPPSWPDPGWHQVGAASAVRRTQSIPLNTAGVRYTYYLVWITTLGGHDQVAINELTLYR
jgi:serine/threonine-protein kinase